jgi:hypothetical protein
MKSAHLTKVEAGAALGSVSHSTKPGAAVRGALKRAVVWAACWGLLPRPVASWLIRKGGLAHA